MAKGKEKGSDFERETCKKLSLWWTEGKRNDVFWRTASSGARGTQASKKGESIRYAGGDLTFTDPIGRPLIDFLTIELKRGYTGISPFDVIDRANSKSIQEWEKFVDQAVDAYLTSTSYSWALITRRDRRESLIWTEIKVFNLLNQLQSSKSPAPRAGMRFELASRPGHVLSIGCTRLDDFLALYPPSLIMKAEGYA